MSPRLGRGRQWLLATDRSKRHHRPRTPDHAGRKRPGERPLEVQGELGEANQRVVAVFGQQPCLGRVFVPPVLVSDDGGVDGGVGDERGP